MHCILELHSIAILASASDKPVTQLTILERGPSTFKKKPVCHEGITPVFHLTLK